MTHVHTGEKLVSTLVPSLFRNSSALVDILLAALRSKMPVLILTTQSDSRAATVTVRRIQATNHIKPTLASSYQSSPSQKRDEPPLPRNPLSRSSIRTAQLCMYLMYLMYLISLLVTYIHESPTQSPLDLRT